MGTLGVSWGLFFMDEIHAFECLRLSANVAVAEVPCMALKVYRS
jgi:hypothetical protein